MKTQNRSHSRFRLPLAVFGLLLLLPGLASADIATEVNGTWKITRIFVAGRDIPIKDASVVMLLDKASGTFKTTLTGGGKTQVKSGTYSVSGTTLTLTNSVSKLVKVYTVSFKGNQMTWTRKNGDVMVSVRIVK